jgi:hypothetical protein
MTSAVPHPDQALPSGPPHIGLPVLQWIVGAWRRLGWRHFVIAILLGIAAVMFAPNGGAWLYVGQRGPDPILEVLSGQWIVQTFPLIFAALVADEASDAGVGPFLAYGSAIVLSAILLPPLDPVFTRLVGLPPAGRLFNNFLFIELILEGGFFVSAWGYWHVTQRAIGLAHAAEAERVCDQQRLFNARLMTLQARVEPQFLFDALSKVRETHERDAGVADTLLADMISLLRAMLPTTSGATSTVEREFGLARGWVRVQSQIGGCAELDIADPGEAAASALGPMLVLPMLRAAIGGADANAGSWRLAAHLTPASKAASGRRLQISLTPGAGQAVASNTHFSADMAAVQERVTQLYGNDGALAWRSSAERTELVLDVPLATGDGP